MRLREPTPTTLAAGEALVRTSTRRTVPLQEQLSEAPHTWSPRLFPPSAPQAFRSCLPPGRPGLFF